MKTREDFSDRQKLYRILDANFNRCREGLRVCEDISRFVLDDASLTLDLKKSRHAVSRILEGLGSDKRRLLLGARRAGEDVGRGPSALEKRRTGRTEGLFYANLQRAKESLRVLEETFKLQNKAAVDKIKEIRFRVYEIEKKALRSLRDR